MRSVFLFFGLLLLALSGCKKAVTELGQIGENMQTVWKSTHMFYGYNTADTALLYECAFIYDFSSMEISGKDLTIEGLLGVGVANTDCSQVPNINATISLTDRGYYFDGELNLDDNGLKTTETWYEFKMRNNNEFYYTFDQYGTGIAFVRDE